MLRHRLWGPPFSSPQAAVAALTAMQSQEYLLAKWTVAQRAGDVGDAEMDRLFDEGQILRTHVLRPTWHFVAPADIRWLLALTGPRVHAVNAHYYRKLGLDDAVLANAIDVLEKALDGGRHLTRKELGASLAEEGIDANNMRLGYVLMHAELNGVICSGARKGKQQTYALLDERVPPAPPRDRDEALAELVRRYFTTRGPATLKDFQWWSSLTAADGKRGLDLSGSELEQLVVHGRTYWQRHDDQPAPHPREVVDLVQIYDEYVMSYSESRDVLTGGLAAFGGPREGGLLIHAILLDGQLVGHWRRRVERTSVVVETWLYSPLDRTGTEALDAAVHRYGRFLGLPAERREIGGPRSSPP